MFIINLQFLTLQYFWKWIYHTGQRSRDTTKCAKIVPKVLWVLLSTILGKGLEILQNVQKLYPKYYEFSCLPYWAKVWRYYKMCKNCIQSIMSSPLYRTGQRSGDITKSAKIVSKVLRVLLSFFFHEHNCFGERCSAIPMVISFWHCLNLRCRNITFSETFFHAHTHTHTHMCAHTHTHTHTCAHTHTSQHTQQK